MLAASFVLATFLAAPQEPTQDPRFESVLSSSDIKNLKGSARELMTAEIAYQKADMDGDARGRQRANQVLQKARESFNSNWERRSGRHGDLLAYMGDVVQIFENCFEYSRPDRPTLGSPQDMGKAGTIVVPRRYRPDDPYRGVLLVPTITGGAGEPAKAVSAREYWDATWKDSTLGDETLICMPALDSIPATGLDPARDLWSGGDGDEQLRIRALLMPFLGNFVQEFNVDRERMVLDCGVGSSAFGLRLATYFPNRFAALILRDAQAIQPDIRLGGLMGLPVLLVEHQGNGDAVAALAKALNNLDEGACTVVKSSEEAPFGDVQGAIDEWITDKRRNMFRSKVVIENNHDLFRKGYWVEMGTAQALGGIPADERARLEVEADRATNRIVVTSRGVENFTLYLNDALVDLSQPFTVEINGKAFKEERARSMVTLQEQILKGFDPGFLFTAVYRSAVPEKGDG